MLPENPLCLITDDGTALTPALTAALSKQGWTPAVLRFSGISDFSKKKRKSLPKQTAVIELSSSDETELQSYLKNLEEKHGSIGGFINLHPVSSDSSSLKLEEGANAFLRHAFITVKNIVSSLKNASKSGSRRSLFLAVSRMDGQLGMGSGEFGAVGSGHSGLVKTASIEWPEVFCRFIDLHPELPADEAANCILQELHDPNSNIKEVGYFPAEKAAVKRMTVSPKKVRYLTTADAESSLSEESVFLVSGGARGVTAECVIKLAEAKSCCFILLGRSSLEDEPEWTLAAGNDTAKLKQHAMMALADYGEKPTPAKVNSMTAIVEAGRSIRNTLERIRNTGSKAEYISTDVTDAKKLKSAIVPAVKKFGTVTGVIHGAGVLADKLIEKKTGADFDKVCSTKINGIDALLKCVNPKKLTHLLLFSSAAGFYGNAGQSDYAIANEALNRISLLFKQKHPKCHVTSFNWGPWEGGMVTPELKRIFEERNVEVISVKDGTRVFVEEVTSSGQHNPIVLVGNSMAVSEQPGSGIRKWEVSRKLNLEDNPVFHDHKIGGTAVLPAVHAISWMIEACEQKFNGFKVLNCKNFKVLNGVKFDQTLAENYSLNLQENERTDGNYYEIEAKVSSNSGKLPRLHYSSLIRLVQSPSEVPLHDNVDLNNTHNLTGSTFYQDGTLFHGPKFQGIQQVLNISEQGLTLECLLPEITPAEQGPFVSNNFNPFAMDLAFQAMLIWVWRFHKSGSLPLSMEMLENFRHVPYRDRFYLSMSVNKNSASAIKADLFLHDQHGLLYSRITGAEVTISQSLNSLFGKTTKSIS